MPLLHLKLFERSPQAMADRDSPEYLFASTYLSTRFTVGLIAFALPWNLVLADALFLDSPRIRGSMSAYYHSSAREVFVGALFVVGAFMVSYMSARPRTYDFWFSSVGGLAAIGVALFPTGREIGVEASATSCDDVSGPPACSAVQAELGERTTELVHLACAGVLVLLLAALCVVFALRELGYGPAARELCGPDRDVRAVLRALRGRSIRDHLLRGLVRDDGTRAPHARAVVWQASFAVVIVLGGAFAVTVSTYWGEVVAFTGFGCAWLYAGRDYAPVRAVTEKVIGPSPADR